MPARRPVPRCPKCDSVSVVPIAYGLPGAELTLKAQNGQVVLGGCCVTDDDDDRACKGCGATWRSAAKPR